MRTKMKETENAVFSIGMLFEIHNRHSRELGALRKIHWLSFTLFFLRPLFSLSCPKNNLGLSCS